MNATLNQTQILTQNLAANIMDASRHLPLVLSKAQRNLAEMYLDHLKAEYGDEAAQQRWTVPTPIFISHPAYTEISLVDSAPVALGAPSNSWLRVIYYTGRIFTENRQEPTNTDWIRPAIGAIFAAQPYVLFQDDQSLIGQFTGLGGTFHAVDKVVEEGDAGLVFYGAVAATEYYQNHSVQKLYFVYHDNLRLFLVDAFGWGQGTPGCHRLVGFSIDGLGFYQNGQDEHHMYSNPQTGENYRLPAPLSTALTSVWIAPTTGPAGVYAFPANPRTPEDWQYRLTPHTPGDVPKTTAVAEEYVEDTFERREKALEAFAAAHEGLGQQAFDYGLLVTILSRQVPRDLLRDVFIDEEGSLLIDVGMGPAADERFVFRKWRGETNDAEVVRPYLVQPQAVEAPAENLDHVSEGIFEEATHARRDDGMELLETHAVAVEGQPEPTSIEVVENYIKPKLEEQKGSLFAVGASSHLISLFDQFALAKLQGDVERMSSIFDDLKTSKIDDAGETTLFDLLPELELAAKIAIDEAKTGPLAGYAEGLKVTGDRVDLELPETYPVVEESGVEQVTGDRDEYLNRRFMLAMQGGDLDLMEKLFPHIEARVAELKEAGAPDSVLIAAESAVSNCRKNIDVVKARRDELESILKDLGNEKPE